jgi:23S rRNA pseudouridine2605 synthase
MTEKKPSKRSGAAGGDRPLRRREPAAKSGPARDKTPKFDKKATDAKGFKGPKGAKGDKPRATRRDKPLPAPVEKTSAFEGERIAKAMARAGVCSRRDAEDWIAAGRVAVNGVTLTTPAVNVTEADKVTVDGVLMQARERTRLFLFHKPAGYVTTAHDPEGRETVFSFIDERHPDLPRLISVGRLDINTEGLLLLTNDGGLARTLELPATGWTRRYRVRAHGETDQAILDRLRDGVTIDDVTYAPIEARLEREQGSNVWIAMSLTEGKNREVKRVMEHLGLDVTRLIRVSYGPFQLGDLPEGAVEEVKLKVLRDQLGKSLAELAGVDFASPLREATPEEEQEQRQRIEKRSRKHVSVLRKERDERSEKGPRARIERGATADRKGRAVAVEKVTLTRRRKQDEEAPETRNARRFDAMRAGPRARRNEDTGPASAERPTRRPRAAEGQSRDAGFERPRRGARGEEAFEARRPSRFEGERGERPARAPRRDDDRPSRAPRGATGEGRGASRTGERPRRSSEEFGARRPSRFDGERAERPARAPRRDDERAPRGGAGEGRGSARTAERPRRSNEEFGARGPSRFEGERAERPARAPRRDDDRPLRSSRGGASEGRGPRRNNEEFAARRPSRFEGERLERAPRDASRGRPRDGERYEGRPPRRDDDRPPRSPRGAASEGRERPRREFDSGRAERPSRSGESRPPRSGAERGPHRGPPKGKGPGKGGPRGPSKGPRKGPPRGGAGPSRGPRKPRGA